MWNAIGVMSGSSLDGLDVALCRFEVREEQWAWSIERAHTLPYPDAIRQRLLGAMEASALELARLHRDLGTLIGEACRGLAGDERIDVIGSHGHTVFHRPNEGLTTQIGCGAQIAAISGIVTVCDLRTKDVALGGQGAPLVPLGERILFPGHDAFLNLGGISNVSVHRNGRTIGYDIGPCNMLLNALAAEAGEAYDANGHMASNGAVDPGLLTRLEELPFYTLTPPRSLGREWFDAHLQPLISDGMMPLADRMRTAVEHIALRIAAELDRQGATNVLVSGGGAHNGFLIDRLRALGDRTVELPAPSVIDMKEALIFALLGLLRLRGEANALASVTGARRDSVGGAVYVPN